MSERKLEERGRIAVRRESRLSPSSNRSLHSDSVDDSLEKAGDFLSLNCIFERCYQSEVSRRREMKTPKPAPREIFTSLVILDLLDKKKLEKEIYSYTLKYLQRNYEKGYFYFFEDRSLLPPDLDCVSLGLSLFYREGLISTSTVSKIMEEILSNTNQNAIIQVYLDPIGKRQYVDAVVCSNAVSLLTEFGYLDRVWKNVEFLMDFLIHKKYLKGTRYYFSPDAFLYFLTRCVMKSEYLGKIFFPLLIPAVRERQGNTIYPLDLAMRIICARTLGMETGEEVKLLKKQQQPAGGWPADALYRAGKNRVYFGSALLSTAFALKALG